MYNYLNIPNVFRDIDNNSPIPFTWEGNKYGEKGIQTAKEEFVSQRGNFGEAMVNKIYKKKVLEHFNSKDTDDIEVTNKFKTYKIELRIMLQNKLE